MSVRASLIKIAVFVAISVLSTIIVISTLINPIGGSTADYKAVFTDATGVAAGSDVQISGVRVGRVQGVELVNNQAVVNFQVEADQHMPLDGRAVVRYADLLGSRALDLEPGPSGAGTTASLPAGSTIPVQRTQPALDLTSVLNGFRPLFDALDPTEVNQLAGEIIAVFQGQGATVRGLLQRTVSVTQNLVAKDQIIDGLLGNLNSVLKVTMDNRPNFVEMIGSLNTLVGGLAQDRTQIVDTLDSAGTLAQGLAGLVDQVKPKLVPTLASLGATADTVTTNQAAIGQGITGFDQMFTKLGVAASYGSWVNVYICNVRLGALGQSLDAEGPQRSAVCR
jgi:phospholipid/cholesterol/gamma-HCH transport system substrate-binding protein